MSSYSDKLKDSRWKAKRKEIIERDNKQCRLCGMKDVVFHVHHQWYDWDTEPWDYEDECYLTMCPDCHEEYHVMQDTFKKLFTPRQKAAFV